MGSSRGITEAALTSPCDVGRAGALLIVIEEEKAVSVLLEAKQLQIEKPYAERVWKQ